MSKGVKAIILVVCVAGISGGAWWFLKNSHHKSNFLEQEINIEQAEVPEAETSIHKDWAGFSFEYPSSLSLEEVELDDETIYSSLELSDAQGNKMTVRIADSDYKDTDDWLNSFEENNVASNVVRVLWADISAVSLNYAVPKLTKTVAIEDKIIYELESPADDNGFWNQAHQSILTSFKFDKTTVPAQTTNSNEETEDILLIEETIE